MVIHWASFGAGIIAAPLALFFIIMVGSLALRAFSKNRGLGSCQVCSKSFTCEPGEYTRIGIWLRNRWHNWVIWNQKWHRDKWARNRWNPHRLPGYPVDNGAAATRRSRPPLLARIWWAVFA